MKIYEHPLKPEITVIEIEKSDEKKDFLNEVIVGFSKYGVVYNSSSFGSMNEKPVVYVDCRKRDVFSDCKNDVACALTIRLAEEDKAEDNHDDFLDKCISIAEASGNDQILERLISKPPEFFNMFRNVQKIA